MDKDLSAATTSTSEIIKTIYSAKEKWEIIGLGLGLRSETLKSIRKQHSGRVEKCLFAVVNMWLVRKDDVSQKGTSWRSLIRTLKSPEVNEPNLAQRIMEDLSLQKQGPSHLSHRPPLKKMPTLETHSASPVTARSEREFQGGEDETLLTIGDLQVILELLKGVESKWYSIGLALGFLDGDLKTIQCKPILFAEAPMSFFREMLSQWLKWTHDKSSIGNLANALGNITVGEEDVAYGLKEKFLQMRGSTHNRTQPLLISKEQAGELQQHKHSRKSSLERKLRSMYSNRSQHDKKEWPPTLDVEYINLSLIQQRKILTAGPHLEERIQLSIGGKIQGILRQRGTEGLSLEDITKYKVKRKIILIEGAPGVGKTTLALELSKRWGMNIVLTEFSLVLYIPLREPILRVAESPRDLLQYFDEICTEEDIRDIVESCGRDVLLLLDGWDELRPSCRVPEAFFPRLIQGEFLPESSIIVTSRPGSTDCIRPYANRFIEILGFTAEQVQKYILSYFRDELTDDGKHAGEKLIEDLEEYPNVADACYIAINLTIVCYVYQISFQLPPTLTEVYESFIVHAVLRHFKKLQESSSDTVPKVEGIVDFDCSIQEVLKGLGQLALNGLRDNELSFTDQQLSNHCLKNDKDGTFDGYGLLKVLHVFRKFGSVKSYHFLHLSVQEFLAAYRIAQMKEAERKELLEESICDIRFSATLRFLCGIDQFKSQSLCHVFAKLKPTTYILECIFEGQWESRCKIVAQDISNTLQITMRKLVPYECLVLSYVMAKSKSLWHLQLHRCPLGEWELKAMGRYLVHAPRILRVLSLSCFPIVPRAVSHLVEIVQSQSQLSELTLDGVELNNESLLMLSKALCRHNSLQVLKVPNNCLTAESAEVIAHLLMLPALEHVNISGNNLGQGGCLSILSSASISSSDTLQILKLPNVGLELSQDISMINMRRRHERKPELNVTIVQSAMC